MLAVLVGCCPAIGIVPSSVGFAVLLFSSFRGFLVFLQLCHLLVFLAVVPCLCAGTPRTLTVV